MRKAKKQRKKSTQKLLGLESFGKYGLKTEKGELVFYSVQPTNISVLSDENIDVKVHHLMSLLSMIPELDVKRHVKHKKRENPKKAVKKQNTPYKLRIYGVYEV